MKTDEQVNKIFENCASKCIIYKDGYRDGVIDSTQNYWQNLRDQAALHAMQAMMSRDTGKDYPTHELNEKAIKQANDLILRLRNNPIPITQ